MTTIKWDPAKYVKTKEAIIAYFEAALEEHDPVFLLKTVGHIIRSEGMDEIIREFGVSREELGAFPDRPPTFEMAFKLLDLLGFRFEMKQKSA